MSRRNFRTYLPALVVGAVALCFCIVSCQTQQSNVVVNTGTQGTSNQTNSASTSVSANPNVNVPR